jgi:hypothetical protein
MEAEKEISNTEGFLSIIRENAGATRDFLFRGQNSDKPLIPKIARLKPKGDLMETERLLLNEFKRTNPLLLDSHRPFDDWDYLTLGQHFGLPTRLLDWSNNALTALWFATNHNSLQEVSYPYGVVWMLMADQDDFDLRVDETDPFSITKTKIFRPRIIKQRINNQSAVFSIQSTKEIIEKTELNDTDAFRNKLMKIKIARENFYDIRSELNTLGVSAFSIFPELEGLCSYLQWQYFE